MVFPLLVFGSGMVVLCVAISLLTDFDLAYYVIGDSRTDEEKFKVLVSRRELDTLLTIVDAFAAALKQANVTFFLYSGSLVGSWRHHGLVPWDDDVDFVLPASLRPRAEQALNKLAPTFLLSKTQKIRWKIYHQQQSDHVEDVDWKWPYVDLSFYEENSTHVWDMDQKHFPEFVYKKADVFPLTRRPFEGRLLPAPRNASSVLRQTYDVDMCSVTRFSHRREAGIPRRDFARVRCERLQHLFPFVVRESGGTGVEGGGGSYCREILLWKNGTTVSCCFLDRTVKEC